MSQILFAIAPHTPLAERKGARERVANRFGGLPHTTRLVSVCEQFRLYAMDEVKR